MHYIARYRTNGERCEEIFKDEREFLKLCGSLFSLEDSQIEGFYHITEDGFMRKTKVSMFEYKLKVCLTFPFSRKHSLEDYNKVYVCSEYKDLGSIVESYSSMEEVDDMLKELSSVDGFKAKFIMKVNFDRKEYERTDLE